MDIYSTESKVKLRKTFKQLLPTCDLKVIFKNFLMHVELFQLQRQN